MNKRQKEVIQHQLDSEKAVLEQLEKQYKQALNDINSKIKILQSDELTQSRIYHIQYQKALKKQVTAILEKLHSDEFSTIQQFLSNSYTNAFVGTFYDLAGQGIPIITPVDQKAAVKAIMTDTRLNKPLYDELGVDVNELKKAVSAEITRGLATGLTYEDMARNLSFKTKAPLARANTIIRTESHRIQQASAEDARQVSKSKGADVVKQWDATLDGDTRDTHRKLDGQIRETDEPFEANGKKAMYPGDFGDPAEDCNCRCVALTRARWALDEDELKTLKERAEYFGLDKTKDFESFRSKYILADSENKARNGNSMWSEEKELQWQKSRRVYGHVDGGFYKAQATDKIVLEAEKRDNVNGEWTTIRQTVGEYQAAANEDKTKLVVIQLPDKAPRLWSDETQNVILTGGRVAVSYRSGNNNTRYIVQAMVENEIDILGGIREEGVFYRVTKNDKEAGYIKQGKIRVSKNHMTGEKEDGLSVWERPKYADKHLHKISGTVISTGSDGEPILDIKTVKMIEEDDDSAMEKRKEGRKLFMEKYGWTEEQITQALRGGFKKTR